MQSMYKKKSRRKLYTIAGIVVVLLVAGYTAAAYNFKFFPFTENNSHLPKNVNLKKSDSEKKAEKQTKVDPDKSKTKSQNTDVSPKPSVSPQTHLQQANVVLTSTGISGGQIQASGFISNIIENDGTCEFTFTAASTGEVVKKSSSTLSNPSSTACKTISFSKSDLHTGNWQVQIVYNSAESEGSSNKMTLTVS